MGTPASGFVRRDAHLQPLGTVTFQTTSSSSLVNSHPTFFSLINPLISSPSSREPTSEQEQAIATLKDYHNSDVIAWHRLSQSTEPGLRQRDGPGGLSIQEVNAISTLRDCSRETLLQWLESSKGKSPPNVSLSASRFAAAASSRQIRRPSPRSDQTFGHLSLGKSVKALPPLLSNNPYSALTAAHNPLAPVQTILTTSSHKTSALVRPPNPCHKYWCTVCGNRSYQNSDDWKKHEKEHEAKYVCMLKGLFEFTEDGRRCVLCGALNQADSHLLAHNIAPCLEAADRPSFKRRYDMVGHLKDFHHILNGGMIADKWRCKSSKKAWSCGFCIKLLPSLPEYLKHVGSEHFEKGQRINDWDFTKVILGLLLQPEIQEAWQDLLDSLDPYRLSETKWNKLGSEELRHRLEKGLTGNETAQSLAKAAYDSTEFDWSLADIDATAFAAALNTVPSQYAGKSLSPPTQDHAVISGGKPVEGSSIRHQASQITSSSPTAQAQSAYGTSALSPSPAHLVPVLDHGSVSKPLASDTDDTNSTRPTTPFNGNFNPTNPSFHSPWGDYNQTPDPAHSDQETFHYERNNKIDWSAIPLFDLDVGIVSSTLKRPRDSTSPPGQTLPRRNSLNDRPRKKAYRKKSEEKEAASQSLNLNQGRRETCDDEDTRSEMGANRDPKDRLYK